MLVENEYISKKTQLETQNSSKQISEKKQDIKYDTRDYVIGYIVQRFGEEEFYISPEYQRNFVWSDNDRCSFIESLLMGLPIPFMFFADTDDGRIEIIDGAQRIQTLVQFAENNLELKNLKVLIDSNGFRFKDLEIAVQRRFLNTNIRVVFLEEGTSVETRELIFKRINTGGLKLNPAEIRRGSFEGEFKKFLEMCVENDLFNELVPRSKMAEKRFEGFELISRFFAYLNNYENRYEGYTGDVMGYIDNYIVKENARFSEGNNNKLISEYINEFNSMLTFAKILLGKQGFRKTTSAKSTPRARFEALSVGIALALRENSSLAPTSIDWLDSVDFIYHTRSDAANNKSRLIGRINYVKNKLLSGD